MCLSASLLQKNFIRSGDGAQIFCVEGKRVHHWPSHPIQMCSDVGSLILVFWLISLLISNFRWVILLVWVIFDINEVFRWCFLKYGMSFGNSGFLSTSTKFFGVYRRTQNIQNYRFSTKTNENTYCVNVTQLFLLLLTKLANSIISIHGNDTSDIDELYPEHAANNWNF